MIKKFLIPTASLAISLGIYQPQSLSLTLYNGDLRNSPTSQGELSFGALSSSGMPLAPMGFESITTGGVSVITNANGAEYAGYSNYNPLTASFLNPSFPTLDQNKGYSILFNFSLDTTTDNSPNRAAFSLTAIGEGNQGIEIGFESNTIFAQNSNFTRGENVSFSTSENIDYEVKVLGNQYQLLANNSEILNGFLRTYSFNPLASDPPLGTFNPYEIPNFLFFGDNTGQEFGSFTFSSAEVIINSTTVPESSNLLALGIFTLGGIMVKLMRYYQ
jgi:hypothetical protein